MQIQLFFTLIVILVAIEKLKAQEDAIITTLDGPFKPVTRSFDPSLRTPSQDLPNNDPRFARQGSEWSPEQIAIAQGVDPASMYISWITGDYQIGQNIEPLDPSIIDSIVRYGTSQNNLIDVAKGKSSVYSQLYAYEGLKNYTSGIIHHVKITGLKPQTTYYYQCGDPNIDAMSEIFSFTTLPTPGTGYPGKIAIVGDLGLTYNTTSTLAHIMDNSPDMNIFIGDMSYANLYLTNGTGAPCYECTFGMEPTHETYQPRWDFWGRYTQALRSTIPTMVIEGNHEFEAQAGHQSFVAYNSRFAVPFLESGSPTKMYYSFNAGGIHFIMIGAYIDYSKTSAQYAWLKQDLEAVDRYITPWVVVFSHAPWYSSYLSHYRETECMRQAMEDLLYQNRVDVFFSGHVHAYERMNKVYNYEYDSCAPVHIVIGDGGNWEHMAAAHADDLDQCPHPESTPDPSILPYQFCGFNFTSGPAAGKFCWDRQPDWSALRETSFGHGILEVKNFTHALWTWNRNQDVYEEYRGADQIYIVRQPDVCAPYAWKSKLSMVETKGEGKLNSLYNFY